MTLEHHQQREEHWVFADMVGKGGHVRTIPIPAWVASGLQSWITAANLRSGTIFRAINKAGQIAANGFSPKVIWGVVKDACSKCAMPGEAPHDLRRTCARLCHVAGERYWGGAGRLAERWVTRPATRSPALSFSPYTVFDSNSWRSSRASPATFVTSSVVMDVRKPCAA